MVQIIQKPTFQFKKIPNINYTDVIDFVKNDKISKTVKILERLPTARECLNFYFQYISQNPKDSTVIISAVGMHIDGRRSAFNLYFCPGMSVIFAVDDKDKDFVAVVPY
jgi:hypothetical protein